MRNGSSHHYTDRSWIGIDLLCRVPRCGVIFSDQYNQIVKGIPCRDVDLVPLPYLYSIEGGVVFRFLNSGRKGRQWANGSLYTWFSSESSTSGPTSPVPE